MVKSMTAFGRGESAKGDIQLVIEIRSLNNRYRDIILKLPKSLQFLEDDIRSAVAGHIQRGRVEITLQSTVNGEDRPGRIELNLPVARAYLDVFKQLEDEFGMPRNVRLDQFCQLSDVIVRKPEELDESCLRECAAEALRQAIESHEGMRIREGRAMEADFSGRLGVLEGYTGQVSERSPRVVEAYRQRLAERMRTILGETELDEARLAQEAAFFADRSDITEEVVRMNSHIEQFRTYLANDEAVGRRLDFLLQEMHREVNTMGSKSSDTDVSRIVVEMKSELEKIREQVQNVE